MHTLSVFPQLLTFVLVAPFLLRLICVVFLALLVKDKYQKSNWLLVIPLTIATLLLILGLYTQVAALLALILIKIIFWTDRKNLPFSQEKTLLYITIEVVLISLLFTGPGFLAFDFPL